MHWLKKHVMHWWFKDDKTWCINIRQMVGFVWVEITDPPFMWVDLQDMYIDLLDRIFQRYKVVALSQKVDERQWNIGDREQFVNKIRQKLSMRATITADYGEPHPPKQTDDCFVIHTVGAFDRSLFQEVIRFGMVELPNITYGLTSIPEVWPLEIFEWNKIFISWFRLKASSSALLRIIEQVDLLCFTIDGHLSFGLPEGSELERILASVVELAHERSLEPVIEQVGQNRE